VYIQITLCLRIHLRIIKVKYILVEEDMKAQRESKNIYFFFNLGARLGGWSTVSTVQEAGCAPRPVWTGEENIPSPEFDPRTVQPVASR